MPERQPVAQPPDPLSAVDAGNYRDLLRQRRTWAGNPSLAALAKRSGVPRSTLHDALHPSRRGMPALDIVRRLVHALGAEAAEANRWAQAWRAVHQGTAARPAMIGEPAAARQPPGGKSVPRQLPGKTAGFVGRDAEEKVLAEFGTTGAVLICGHAGVGKSALAVQWAHRIAGRFPDGQLYVNLRGFSDQSPVSPSRALVSMLRGLGVPDEQIPDDLDELTGRFRTSVADSRILIVLDDAASAAQVRPLLPGGPGCLALVTSRLMLRGLVAREGARTLTLGRLTEDGADRLLAEVLGAERAGREPHAVAELARLCGYVPLALRIAGANLAARPLQTIAEYADELRTDRLTALTIEGEQEAVQATLLASYTRLAPASRRLLRRLGVLAGDFAATTAAAVEYPAGPIGTSLGELTAAHLVERLEGSRYRIHDLVHVYATHRLAAEEDPEAVRCQLLDWAWRTAVNAVEVLRPQMVRLPAAREVGPPTVAPALTFTDVAAARAWLDSERTTLVELIVDATDYGLGRYAWRLADALRGYFWLRVPRLDWLTAAEAGLTAAVRDGDRAAAAAMHHCLGDAAWSADDYCTAERHFRRGLQLCRAAGDRYREVALLINLGLVGHESGDLDGAERHLSAAVAVCHDLGDRRRESDVLGRLGALAGDRGRLDEAERTLRLAVLGQQGHGTRYRYAGIIGSLGTVLRHRGHLKESARCLSEAMAIYREVGNRQGEAGMLEERAVTLLEGDQVGEAAEDARLAATLAAECGDQRTAADVYVTLAAIDLRTGTGNPRQWLVKGLRIARARGHRYTEIRALLGLSDMLRRAGRSAAAAKLAQRAAAIAETTGLPLLAVQALTGAARARLAAGDPDTATSLAERALAGHREYGQRLWEARTLLLLAQALAATGRIDEARHARRQAEATAGITDVPWERLIESTSDNTSPVRPLSR